MAEKEEVQKRKVERLKKMIDEIPSSTEGLFSYPLDWNALESSSAASQKVVPWVQKRVTEYLGEDVPTLVQFVNTQVKERAKPETIRDELVEVLDADAEAFVIKLWRFLILETMQAQVGL
jgi:RNA-binding protein 25